MEAEKDILKKHITENFNQNTPSIDFTEVVMQKVEKSIVTKTVIAPLIPKSFWKYLILLAGLIVILSFVIEMPKSNLSWFDNLSIELPKISNYKTTINMFFSVIGVLIALSLVDLIYRKTKTLA